MCKNSWIILVPLLGCIANAQYPTSEEILPPIVKDHVVGQIVSVKTEKREYDFKRCTIELPDQMGIKEELEFSPTRSPKLPKNVERSLISPPTRECNLNIRDVDYKEAGKWLMRSYVMRQEPDRNFKTNHTVKQEFTIRLVKEVESMPKRELRITEGNNLHLRLKDSLPDMVSCSVRSPDGKTHVLWQNNQNSGVNDSDNQDSGIRVQYWGTSPEQGYCGMKMIDVKNSTAGEWHLEAVDKNEILHKAMIKVYVDGSKSDLDKDYSRKRSLTLGSRDALDLAPKSAIWCRAKHTKGGKEQYCHMNFDPVKKSDAKTWHVSWTSLGSAQVHDIEVEIIVREFRQIDTTVEKINAGEKINYNLLCRILSKGIEHCIFERPDGKIINLEPGVGTGRYSYFGEGFTSSVYKEEINECGLSIEDSQAEDIGVWKCAMNDANEKENLPSDVAYLRVGSDIHEEQIPHSSNQNKDAFITGNLTLSCWIRSSLDYCLIQHPNGTTYVPNEENSSADIYDLRSGRCGLQFYKVTTKEAGEWRCRMGISGGSEILTKHVVAIHESAMVPHGNTGVQGNAANITCIAINLPSLSYCRFTRPDGIGMHSAEINDERYKFTGDLMNGLCMLTISQIAKVDHGTWKCSAGLLDYNQEISTHYRLFLPLNVLSGQAQTPIILIVVSCLSLILIGMVSLYYKFRNKESLRITKRYSRNSMPKPTDPIPFYLEADSPASHNKV